LPDATEPLVLRPDATEIRPGEDGRRPARTPDDGTGTTGHERLVGGGGAIDDDRMVRRGVSQTAVLPASQWPSAAVAHKDAKGQTEIPLHRRRTHKVLPSPIVHLNCMGFSHNNFCHRHEESGAVQLIRHLLFSNAIALDVPGAKMYFSQGDQP